MEVKRQLKRKAKIKKFIEEDKEGIVSDAISKKLAPILRQNTANAMQEGFLIANKIYYEKYAEPFTKKVTDRQEEPPCDIIMGLLNEIGKYYQKYKETHEPKSMEENK